ncbi:MAG TPA: glycosyltransferase [Edaphocola sp.]|nr:glycosyltransferase [Edaphocola sp.]
MNKTKLIHKEQYKRILIAPLDWGLGHTTRCIPLIRHLKALGHAVVVATEGVSAQILKENFTDLEIINLKGYHINYSKRKSGFSLKIIAQLPKIFKAIQNENKFLEQYLLNNNFDLIISDNRYGFYSSKIKSVILTHQIQILSGKGKFIDAILRKIHKNRLEKFDECWIVDQSKQPGLSGVLAHPKELPSNHKYIGWLSQLDDSALKLENQKNKHFLILLSGPEPMRSQLEEALWRQCSNLKDYTFSFVSGKPNIKKSGDIPEHIEWFSHLTREALIKEFEKATAVICRSGYSTLMDLMFLKRPALLIPTPGQTEQEYLAKHVSENIQTFKWVHQKKLNLEVQLGAFNFQNNDVNTFQKNIIDFRKIISL